MSWFPWKHSYSGGLIPSNVNSPIVFSEFIEENQRQLNEQIHGIFEQLVTGDGLSSGDDIVYTNGLGKIFIVVNAGSDIDGVLTITGTQVDRNTGVETPATSEEITIDTLTTDDSDTDSVGNTRHAFTNGYLSSNWYKGSVMISTTNLTLTDVDIYNVGFEQVNDTPNLTLKTFDCTALAINAAAWLFAYLYCITVNTTTKKANITREGSLELPAADVSTNVAYRLRKGNLDVVIDGSKDGFWIDAHFGPNNQSYWVNITMKVWFELLLSLT